MPGMDRHTGKALDGWPHVQQSLNVLLTTSRRSRVMRRAFGAGLPRRVDMPISPANVIDLYADVAAAITAYEPRFRVTRMRVPEAPVAGEISILAEGIYYPRGALGDFSVSVPQSTTVRL